jgi:serine/threonine-protein kinase
MIPEKIGRYNIEKELGRGGMAVVYLATDPFMSREVAIKVLPRQFTFDPQFRARFQREAQVIAKLDHPAIVPVYDFGEHEEQPFIVMRYMKGGSLADRLKDKGSIPVAEAAEILKRIGSALDEAHLKGIIHRDLKPGNILFDDRGDAFVGDFGIVKMSEATIQYTGNAIIGTPGYMSPEQARGDEEIDGRSDIYSLGAIAYEMLTGKLPYHSDTPMGLVMKHILEPVPNVLADKPDLPANTATVISTAMAKEPNMRYQTCVAIASALSASATVQMQGPGQQATVLESFMPQTDMAGTVVESPSWHPKPQTVPPTRGQTVGGPAIGGPATAPPPAYTAEPEKKRGGIPMWGWAAGFIALLCIGGVVALGGFGVLASVLSGDTPTPEQVVDATATPETIVEEPTAAATNTAEPAATDTPPPVEATATDIFTLPEDTATPPPITPPSGGGAIQFGGTQQGSVAANETQRWTFNASAGDRVDIQVVPSGGDFDLVFNVFGPGQNSSSIVPGGEIDLSFGTEVINNLTIPADGQYTIAVAGYDGASGAYSVSLTSSPPGSTLNAADTLNTGAEHLFPFSSSRGGVEVTAIVVPEGELDIILGIYNDDTDTLIEEVDASFGREILSYNILSSGNYYFRVTGFDAASSGNYDISLSGAPEVTFLLANRDEVLGYFGPSSQLEYFYRGDAGDIFTVSVSTFSSIDLVIEIYAENDTLTPLAEVDNNLSGEDEELTFTIPAEGLYIIRIRDFFGESGSFTMTIN